MNALNDHKAFAQAALSVEPIADKALWDAYLAAARDVSFFHRWEWGEIVRDAYGYEPIRLVARREGAIVGALLMSDVKAPLLGRSLISSAFTVGGGIAADDQSAADALAAKAIEEGRARNVQYVELRGGANDLKGWTAKNNVYASFSKPLIRDEKERLLAIPKKRRAEIRKGLKLAGEGRLTIRHGRDVDAFYHCYARSLRNLGTPIFSKRFVHAIMEAFGDKSEIAVVEADGAPIVALISFFYKDRVMPYYVGALPEARALRGFDFLYWSMMERGIEFGAEIFDFGRSKIGTPHFDYKKYWGFEGVPLRYQYALIGATDTPNVNPNNPKFKIFTNMWKRLPVPVANAIGPMLVRNFA